MWLYALPRSQRTLSLILAVLLAPLIAISIIADQADAIPNSATATTLRQTLDGRTVGITRVIDCEARSELQTVLERIDGEWGWASSSKGTLEQGRRLWVNPDTGWAGVVSWRPLPGQRIRIYHSELDLARLPLTQIRS